MVKNCRKCKSSIRTRCTLKRKAGTKAYTDNRKKTGTQK